MLGFFCRRTRDAELAADLTAETFAAALAGRRRFRPEAGSATAWLYGIASNQLASAQRRATAERRARRRLGIERIELLDADIERINALGESTSARAWLQRLAPDQRDAITAHVIHERGYDEIAEARAHVGGGRAQAREPRARRRTPADGTTLMREDFVTRLEHPLSNAERRRERGSRLSRLLASARAWLPSRAASLGLATAAVVLVAVVVGAVALTGGGDKNTVVGRSPSVVARTSLGEEPLEDLASGFGAAWIGGVERRDVVRVDAATHRVVARIPVGDFPSGIVTAAGAVWVLVYPNTDLVKSTAPAVYTSPTLLRIDPATNRVAAPIPIPVRVPADASSYRPKLLGNSSALWVLGPDGGVRIDPRRSAVAGRVR